MKKIAIFIFTFILCSMLSITNSFAVVDPIYQETGQINLEKANLCMRNGSIDLEKSQFFTKEDKEAFTHLIDVTRFDETLIKSSQNNNLPEVIAYTTYKLKEVDNGNGTVHLEPLTKSEVNALASANETTKHSLTITLSVNSHLGGDTRYISASTYIYWEARVGLSGEVRVANGSDDFCSLSFPSPYKIQINSKGGIEGQCTNPTLNNINNYCAVASFKENNGGTYMRATSTAPKATTKSRRFTTQYVHTWTSAVPSISISSNGDVSFGLTSSSDMWKIAAYLDYTC